MPTQPGQAVSDQFWIRGANSLLDPANLSAGEYQWGDNISNRGGLIGTRPGFGIIGQIVRDIGEPQGIALFNPRAMKTQIIVAVGGMILISKFPYRNYDIISDLAFSKDAKQVIFKTAIKSVDEDDTGSLTLLPYAKPVLIIQDGGISRAGVWTGMTGRHLDPTQTQAKYETPAGSWMEWIGGRLWVAAGKRLYASNYDDPLKFTETGVEAEGGYFSLPSEITGMIKTPDENALLVGTDNTLTSFQAAILDRVQWQQTQGFQKIVLPGIGVAAGKSMYNQYGLTWWMSHEGLIGLDNALQTYRSSQVHYRDQAMMRSKANLSPDLSGVCVGGFENFLMASVPSGDVHNAHTWVMDQAPVESIASGGSAAWSGAWRGIRPVEWVTGLVNGVKRCFCLSRDYSSAGFDDDFSYNVWEAFIGERVDVGFNLAAERIECAFQTRFLGEQFTMKKFEFAQLDLTEISGIVDLEVYYCGLKGAYERILSKRIVATTGSFNQAFTDSIKKTTHIRRYRPQSRIVRTQTVKGGTTIDDNIESEWNQDRDRAFSLLVRWKGRMAIRSLRIFLSDKGDDLVGRCEPDEVNERAVLLDGTGIKSDVVAEDTPIAVSPKSTYFRAHSSSFIEVPYQSFTADMDIYEPDPQPSTVFVAPIISVKPEGLMTQWIDPVAPAPPTTPPTVNNDSHPPNPDDNPRDPNPVAFPANHPGYEWPQ